MLQSTSIYRRSWLCPLLLLGGCSGDAIPEPTAKDRFAIKDTVEPRIEVVLDEMVAKERFSGSVLVVVEGEVVHARGYGSATDSTANGVDTAFHVASITKQFTAAAIMQLVEAGTVELDSSINTYLPEKYRSPAWNEVTIHHLLSHSGGVTDYAVTRDYYDVVDGFCLGDTVDGMIREAMGKELEFDPGSQFSYSNIGFTLLGEIIEEQTGTTYDQYLQDNILGPLEMNSSRMHVEGHVPVQNEAAGYRWDEELEMHVKDDIVSLPVTAPDGGLVTTLSDFWRWTRIYANDDPVILSRESVETMTSQQIAINHAESFEGYGYGLDIDSGLIGHSGYIVGFRSRFYYAPESDTLVAVFTNNTSNNPGRIAGGILSILFAAD